MASVLNKISLGAKVKVLERRIKSLENANENYRRIIRQRDMEIFRLKNPGSKTSSIDSEKVYRAVCEVFDTTKDVINGKCRQRHCIVPRFVFQYIMAMHTQYSLKRIGIMTGHRDHSSVIYGRDEVVGWINSGSKHLENIKKVEKILGVK